MVDIAGQANCADAPLLLARDWRLEMMRIRTSASSFIFFLNLEFGLPFGCIQRFHV